MKKDKQDKLSSKVDYNADLLYVENSKKIIKWDLEQRIKGRKIFDYAMHEKAEKAELNDLIFIVVVLIIGIVAGSLV